MATLIAEQFFGGSSKVKRELALAIQQKRMAKGMTCDCLDQICGFGKNNLPPSQQFEENPNLITGKIFARAAFSLGLKLNSILPLSLSDKMPDVIAVMRDEGVQVTAACGGGDVSKIAMEKQAPVYVYLKLVQELDGGAVAA